MLSDFLKLFGNLNLKIVLKGQQNFKGEYYDFILDEGV